jgi:hypothetical protein
MNDEKSSLHRSGDPDSPDQMDVGRTGFLIAGGEIIFSSSAAGASPRRGPAWTQDESINYECACDCIVHLMAICSGEMHDEATTVARHDALLVERSRLYGEMHVLGVHDHADIARIRRDYGQRVRSHMQHGKDILEK